MEYSGRDNLEVMKYATNYNDAIFNWISSAGTCNKMLDFGAGVGEFCNRFRKDQIEAVEIDVTLHNSINCKVYKALSDISTLFCLIYSLNVLEHIEDDQSYVTQLSFYLESDGLVKILVPARGELYSAMDEKVGHYRRYSKGQLVMLFENSGYDVLECR